MSKVLVTESYLDDIADAIRGKNGGSATYKPSQMAAAIEVLPDPSNLDDKTITANGTYDPSDDNLDGYSEVTVNVPNSYAAGDEGKVVSSGALVSQGSDTVTENDTYDTTLISSLTVNVSGGGGSTNILSGTDVPTAAVGSDGAIYLQYDQSTDEIEYVKLKVNGSWQALIGSDINNVDDDYLVTVTRALNAAGGYTVTISGV